MRWTKESYTIDDDKASLNIEAVFGLLKTSHWANGRSIETIQHTIEHSLCFSLFCGGQQIGFVRVLTDYSTYAVILDMIIDEHHRGKGLGAWLMNIVTNHSMIRHTRQILWTSTAECFYRQCGFVQLEDKPIVMVKPPFTHLEESMPSGRGAL